MGETRDPMTTATAAMFLRQRDEFAAALDATRIENDRLRSRLDDCETVLGLIQRDEVVSWPLCEQVETLLERLKATSSYDKDPLEGEGPIEDSHNDLGGSAA